MRRVIHESELLASLTALLIAGVPGCACMNRTGKGAVMGGAAGAIIGHQMDKRAEELAAKVRGATLTRVGEGIAVTCPSGLSFDFDSDAVKPEAASNLNTLAKHLIQYSDMCLLIVGHTDAVGSEAYDLALFEKRATSAARSLDGRGVVRRIPTAGRGETEPVGSSETEAGRALKRRIEAAMYASEALQEQARQEAAGH